MNGLGRYKLTVVAGVVVLCITAGAIAVFGTSAQSITYLAFVSPTIVALLALLRTEQNAAANDVRHAENRADIKSIQDGQQTLAHEAIDTLRQSRLSIEDAALIAQQVVSQERERRATQ